MQKVRIVTDSATGLPKEILDKYEIINVPVPMYVGDDCFLEFEEIEQSKVYEALVNDLSVKTAAPTPGQFIEVFNKLEGQCETIICIHLVEVLSGTLNSARIAATTVPEKDIVVFDSLSTNIGCGLLVMIAAKAAQEGKGKEDILAMLESAKKNTYVYAALPTVKYAAKSGRLPHVAAFFASVLAIKPIIAANETGIIVADKVRTFPASVSRMIDLVAEKCGGKAEYVIIGTTNSPEESKKIYPNVKAKIDFKDENLLYAEMGCSMAIHGGVGMVGLAVCNLE